MFVFEEELFLITVKHSLVKFDDGLLSQNQSPVRNWPETDLYATNFKIKQLQRQSDRYLNGFYFRALFSYKAFQLQCGCRCF